VEPLGASPRIQQQVLLHDFETVFSRRRKFFSVKVTDDLFLKVFVFVIFGSLSVWFVFC